MQRNIKFNEGEFYHLYNRGVDKRIIFNDEKDYERFLKLLVSCNSTKPLVTKSIQGLTLDEIKTENKNGGIVSIGAYCLMPNHFHILITPTVEDGISKFMQKLQTAYSMYFNKKYERTGALLQGSFKGKHANNDEYLKYLYAYIHLNPAKIIDPLWKSRTKNGLEKVCKFISDYKYSSFSEYLYNQFKIVDPKYFPNYFLDQKEFENLIDFWLNFNENPRSDLGKE